MNRKQAQEIDRLVEGVNPRAKVPRGFAFWEASMQIMWLKQNQKKPKVPKSQKKLDPQPA